jgi:hypothetical protein
MRDETLEVAGIRVIELEHAVLVVLPKKPERNDNANAGASPVASASPVGKRPIPAYMRGCGCGFGYTDDEDSTTPDE